MPKISVLMSAFNADAFISETIESVLKQTYTDFEFVIIDDGSTDKTREIILNFNDVRIKYFYFENSGLSKSLNRGLQLSTGKYIARIDADDICYPERLLRQFTYMEQNPDCAVCGSFADVIDQMGEYIYTYAAVPTASNEIAKEMYKKNCIVHSSSFFKRESALCVGGYYEPIKHYFEDYMFFFKLIKTGSAYNFSEPFIKYRITPGSISSRTNNRRYNKLVLDVVHRGFINNDELIFLLNFREQKAKKKIHLSNHYLALSRLVFIHQLNVIKSWRYIVRAIKENPINLNILLSIGSMFFGYLLNKFNSK